MATDNLGAAGGGSVTGRLVPRWFLRTVLYCAGLLVIGAAVATVIWLLLKLALLSVTLLVALLLAALLDPMARRLRRVMPAWAASVLCVMALLGVLGGTGYVLAYRVAGQTENLRASLTTGIHSIRNWLVNGPLALQPLQVDAVRDRITAAVASTAPSGVGAAQMVIAVLSGVAIAVFVLFFVLKDGKGMWCWIVSAAPEHHRPRVAEAGRRAWETTRHYVLGAVVVALVDAVGIDIGLFLVGVPLALSLAFLVFFGSFVPLIGATVTGAVAVLITLVTNGAAAALIVLGVVLVVQNVEGSLLHPLIQGRAVRLHPVVILVAVTAGYLLFGMVGNVIAVPVAAVSYRVASYLRYG